MADAPDSKSGRGNPVRVQVPPPAPLTNRNLAKLSASISVPFTPDVLNYFGLGGMYCQPIDAQAFLAAVDRPHVNQINHSRTISRQLSAADQ